MTSEQLTSAASETNLNSIASILEKLSLLPAASMSQEKATQSAAEDYSLQITKSTQAAIKWGSGGGAGAAIVGAVVSFLQDGSDIVVVGAIVSAAIVIAAGIFGLARVMDGDVRGRASISTESVRARALIAAALLQIANGPAGSSAQVASEGAKTNSPRLTDEQLLFGLAFSDHLKVTTTSGEFTVVGARWGTDEGLQLRLNSGDWLPTSRVKEFSAAT